MNRFEKPGLKFIICQQMKTIAEDYSERAEEQKDDGEIRITKIV